MTSSTPAEHPAAAQSDRQRSEPDQPGAEPEIGYEQARDELVEVVRRLESGGTSLAETMTLWERGEKLAAICQGWLDGARRRIDQARDKTEQSD